MPNLKIRRITLKKRIKNYNLNASNSKSKCNLKMSIIKKRKKKLRTSKLVRNWKIISKTKWIELLIIWAGYLNAITESFGQEKGFFDSRFRGRAITNKK
jgi:hypothetical protein